MSGGEIEIILNEIRELKKDIKENMSKVFIKIDDQNNRIISAEKDIEYIKIDFDNKVENIENDFNNFNHSYREFKKKEVVDIILTTIGKKFSAQFFMAAVNLIGLMATALAFLFYEFVLKR